MRKKDNGRRRRRYFNLALRVLHVLKVGPKLGSNDGFLAFKICAPEQQGGRTVVKFGYDELNAVSCHT